MQENQEEKTLTIKRLLPMQVCLLSLEEKSGEVAEDFEEIVAISPTGGFYVLAKDAAMIEMEADKKEKIEKILEENYRRQQLVQGVSSKSFDGPMPNSPLFAGK